MKTILVGLGTFGASWYYRLKKEYSGLEVAVVDRDANTRSKIDGNSDRFYSSLPEAIEKERPDFIINATPPGVHTSINNTAFDYKLPVLCEKPISDDFPDALRIVERAVKENIRFMISENYRYSPLVRKLRKLIKKGTIGDITWIHIDFYRDFFTNKEYFINMENPLLVDVTVHHFDLMRYLTGSEGKRIFARSFNPADSKFKGNMNLYMLLEMKNGTVIDYSGSMVCKGIETQWNGNWHIEGTSGAIMLSDDRIHVVKDGSGYAVDDFSDIEQGGCLDEFLLSLKEDRDGETSGKDNIKTQALVHFALESNKKGCTVDIDLSGIEARLK